MSSRDFDLPEAVQRRAESLGQVGSQWLASLGDSVAALEKRWSIQIGEAMTGGSESLVANAHLEDGTAAIVKIGLPGSADLATEARVYRLAAGRGYANLIAHEPSHNALLLEQLGTALGKTGLSTEQQIRWLCVTLQDAWIPIDATSGLMTGAEKARWLAAFIAEQWQLQNRPCDEKTINLALSFAEQREAAFSPGTSVLVHGDAHALNALTIPNSARGECKFVDPDGLFAERACDLAVPMREWNAELLAGDPLRMARERCELLAELTQLDSTAIWQWGFIERVSTGLVLLHIGMDSDALEYLRVADQLMT